MGIMYSITVFLDDFNIVFRDSLKIINSSLGRIGEGMNQLDTIKGETPLLESPPETIKDEWIEYIKTDVRIIGLALNMFYVDFNFTKFTNASESLKNFKKTTNYRKYFPELPVEQDAFLREGYKGGFTYVNPRYKNIHLYSSIIQYDINSMYPFVLLEYDMPIGKPTIIPKFDGEINSNFYYVIECFLNLKLKENHIPTLQTKDIKTLASLGIKKSDYITTTNGDYHRFILTCQDLELIKKHYHTGVIEYGQAYVFSRKKGIFDEYIYKFKEIKEQAKKDGNFLLEMFAKIMLNSLYGKFGSKPTAQQKHPYLENDVLKFKLGDIEEAKTNYIPVAMFTTSLARKYIIEHAQDNYQNYVYSDTDSLHLIGDNSQHTGITLHKTEFGKWSIDGQYTRAIYLRQKLYMATQTDGKVICKGAGITPELKDILNYDNFKIGARFGVDEKGNKIPSECYKKQMKQVKGGAIIINVPFTIKKNDYGF